MSIEYAIIVRSKTRLELLIERFNTQQQAKFYIERSGANFADYELEHSRFQQALDEIQRRLSTRVKNKIIERNFLPSFLFNDKQIVIVVGQDGLVANTAKYVNGIPIIGINPDTERYDGVLLPFSVANFMMAVESIINNRYKHKTVTLAEARLNDGQRLLAFNDLFIGASSHISARYKITYQHKTEEHSSSGIIVSTQAGSTGWLSSVFNMTAALHQFFEQKNSAMTMTNIQNNQLIFVVREPFQSKKTQAGLVAGVLIDSLTLHVESLMPANGVIFSDGIESDFINFNSGAIATIATAKEKAILVTC